MRSVFLNVVLCIDYRAKALIDCLALFHQSLESYLGENLIALVRLENI